MVAPAIIAVTMFTAAMTLKSDTKPVQAYLKGPKGTLYWGGSGLDGAYITPTLNALRRAGISNVSVGLTNTATQDIGKPGMIVDAIRAGLLIRYEDGADWVITSGMSLNGEQFNIIGYSYGSLLAAQTAYFYAKQGTKIDNLVLIASPIDADFLGKLKESKNIKQVIVIDLISRGDQIYAGMSQTELFNPYMLKKLGDDMLAEKGQGHFYYAHPVPELPQRLEVLANWLVKQGLR